MAILSAEARFWSKVDKSGECWIWTASKAGQAGYGYFHISGGGKRRVRTYAHRWAYEQLRGPIPDGLTIDHLCRTPLCVNPDHLEPVTMRENHRRRTGYKRGPYAVGTHCPHGHERSPENTRVNSQGSRICIPCNRAAVAKSRAKRMSTP